MKPHSDTIASGHVDVEDLLHEALVGIERGVEEHQRERERDRARRWRARGRAGRGRRWSRALSPPAGSRTPRRPGGRTPDHRDRGSPAICPAGRRRRGALSSGPSRPGGGDQRRDQQRQADDRADQVAGSRLDRDRRDERADHGEGHIGEHQHRDAARAAAAPARARAGAGRTPGRRSPRARPGTGTAPPPWPRSSAVRSTGASRNASKPPCSRSATNSRLIAEQRGEQQRRGEDAGRELPLDRRRGSARSGR